MLDISARYAKSLDATDECLAVSTERVRLPY